MARDDWRIRIELSGEEHAGRLLERLGRGLGREARELAAELERDRLAVSGRGNTLFVYAETPAQAEHARRIVEAELREHGLEGRAGPVEHWLADEDRWDAEPPGPDIEEELVERGVAPWEVRVECDSHDEAEHLADRLEAEGYDVLRRWRYVIVGAGSREEAEELAARLHGEAEPSSELVWEVMPGNPFAVFGGLGG
jgi:hypothetical protein